MSKPADRILRAKRAAADQMRARYPFAVAFPVLRSECRQYRETQQVSVSLFRAARSKESSNLCTPQRRDARAAASASAFGRVGK
jgi:hypothetical protein